VEDAEASVDLDLAVVAQDRHRDDDLLLRLAEHLVEPRLEIEPGGGVVEAGHHRLEGVLFGGEPVVPVVQHQRLRLG
jgi:hypothetical protein